MKHSRCFRTFLLAWIVCAAATVPALASAGLAINFVGKTNYTPLMGSTEIAGLLTQGWWNNATGSTGTLAGLADSGGWATLATVTWRGSGSYTGITNSAGNNRMMRGYLAPLPGEAVTVTLTGLTDIFGPTAYDVYVYFDGDNAAARWQATYAIGSVSAVGTDLAGTNFAGTFIEDTGAGGNVLVLRHIQGDSFTLTATSAADGVSKASVSGIQIVHTPEPTTLALVLVGLALARRRKSRFEPQT